jgi:O-antigen ligase
VTVFALIPLTFIDGTILGFQPSGWAWLLLLGVSAPIALSVPLARQAAAYLWPLLAFLLLATATLAWALDVPKGVATLAQLTVPAFVYLLAWRLDSRYDLPRIVQRLVFAQLALAGVLAVVDIFWGGAGGVAISTRPMSISLVVLFVMATIPATTWRMPLAVGAFTVGVATFTGSRMSAAVMLLMIVTSPALNLRRAQRIGLVGLAVVFVLVVSQTEAFQERFFFHDDATLTDALTLSESLNTAGRRELWPRLLEQCGVAPVTGLGIGRAYDLSQDLSGGAMTQPHNEYIRTWCETGWVGFGLLWIFFGWALLRSWWAVFTGPRPRISGAAGQLILAMMVYAITDNPLIYTAHLMAPIAVVLALSDRGLRRRGGRNVEAGI